MEPEHVPVALLGSVELVQLEPEAAEYEAACSCAGRAL